MRTIDEISGWYYGYDRYGDPLTTFDELIESIREEMINETVKACIKKQYQYSPYGDWTVLSSDILNVAEQLKQKL